MRQRMRNCRGEHGKIRLVQREEKTPPAWTAASRSRSPQRSERARSQREPSRSNSPTTSLNRGSASPTRHGWYSTAYAEELNLAQEECLCHPVIEEGGLPVGYVYAPPGALISEVYVSMREDMSIAVDMMSQPHGSTYWRDVTSIQFGTRVNHSDIP